MPKSTPPPVDIIQHPADEPLVVYGPPDSLAGEVLLHNAGPEKLIVRDVHLRGEAMARRAARGAEQPQLALRRVVLRPGQQRRLPLQFGLSPHTPPGEYHAEVQVGDAVRQIVMHVTEVIRLDLEPNPIVLDNLPGKTVVKRVVFSNRGNVPLSIGEIGAVVLDEESLNCRAGRAAVMNSGQKDQGLDEFLAEYVRQTKVALEQSGLLRVHNTAVPFTLAPGEVRAVDLEIRVPDKLEPRARYRGAVALYTSTLDIVLTPTQAERAARSTKRRSAD